MNFDFVAHKYVERLQKKATAQKAQMRYLTDAEFMSMGAAKPLLLQIRCLENDFSSYRRRIPSGLGSTGSMRLHDAYLVRQHRHHGRPRCG